MLWKILETAFVVYAVLFVVALPFGMALCKVNGPISRQEEFEAQQWEAEKDVLQIAW
jgi:hypothetical protein